MNIVYNSSCMQFFLSPLSRDGDSASIIALHFHHAWLTLCFDRPCSVAVILVYFVCGLSYGCEVYELLTLDYFCLLCGTVSKICFVHKLHVLKE